MLSHNLSENKMFFLVILLSAQRGLCSEQELSRIQNTEPRLRFGEIVSSDSRLDNEPEIFSKLDNLVNLGDEERKELKDLNWMKTRKNNEDRRNYRVKAFDFTGEKTTGEHAESRAPPRTHLGLRLERNNDKENRTGNGEDRMNREERTLLRTCYHKLKVFL